MRDNARRTIVTERLLLANQCKILEKLYPSDADHYAARREALERGYTLEYSSVFRNHLRTRIEQRPLPLGHGRTRHVCITSEQLLRIER